MSFKGGGICNKRSFNVVWPSGESFFFVEIRCLARYDEVMCRLSPKKFWWIKRCQRTYVWSIEDFVHIDFDIGGRKSWSVPKKVDIPEKRGFFHVEIRCSYAENPQKKCFFMIFPTSRSKIFFGVSKLIEFDMFEGFWMRFEAQKVIFTFILDAGGQWTMAKIRFYTKFPITT